MTYPTILREFATPRQAMTAPGRFVLREMRAGEFATHWQHGEHGGCIQGHYFEGDLPGAISDFAERVVTWTRRYADVPTTAG